MDLDAKSGRDSIRRYVVMGRTDTTSRKHIGVFCPERIHRIRQSLRLLVADDPAFLDRHTQWAEDSQQYSVRFISRVRP